MEDTVGDESGQEPRPHGLTSLLNRTNTKQTISITGKCSIAYF